MIRIICLLVSSRMLTGFIFFLLIPVKCLVTVLIQSEGQAPFLK